MVTKKALLIGINYRGTSSELRGCINDVNNVKEYLLGQGYAQEDFTILIEDEGYSLPTKRNIIENLRNLILSGADRLFFHYSGHGSYQQDQNGDEEDHRDESIVPLDFATEGMIIDDQLRGMLNLLPPTSKMTILLDCCHSGSGIDLCYSLKDIVSWERVYKDGVYTPVRNTTLSMIKDNHYSTTPGEVVMISGCLDNQCSADAYEEGSFQGAMTYCFLKTITALDNPNWKEFFVKFRELLIKNNYSQVPLLSSGKNLNLDDPAVCC